MSISSHQRQSSASPSSASIRHTSSVRSTVARRPPPPVVTVITTPPWARGEPPSPTDNVSLIDTTEPSEPRPFDAASYLTSSDHPRSRWWTFTLPRTSRHPQRSESNTSKQERRGIQDVSSWLPTSTSREIATPFQKGKEKDPELGQHHHNERNWDLALPTPPPAQYTVAQTTTPGWDDPWSPRTAVQGPVRDNLHRENSDGLSDAGDSERSDKSSGKWNRRKKRFRIFILSNVYVPLLFRLINITFTTSALAVAIRIRRMEIQGHALGAVGSSPTVVIIFAPLTLVHVMIAIYLEYFGRPLGLWRTSGKLAHTLSEVLFICAWSAALSLCFDNFFTSLIPCASPSRISWYNELPRPPSILPNNERNFGDRICDYQLALICLVAIGLLAYTTNLIISLFRIFEKVKYHPAATVSL
ncbi:hypothetical protein H0H92_001490 [Tricholoma furcatifolium]|nr:hypothetical protein H0H92_001490 [Tricholoma furcatifolium]